MNRSRRRRGNLMVNLLRRLGYPGRYPPLEAALKNSGKDGFWLVLATFGIVELLLVVLSSLFNWPSWVAVLVFFLFVVLLATFVYFADKNSETEEQNEV